MPDHPLLEYPRWRGYDDAASTSRPIRESSKRVARRVFDQFMIDREERVAVVSDYLQRLGGISVTLDGAGVGAVEQWLWPWAEDLVANELVEPEQLSAFLHDIGTLTGEALIRERAGLEWRLLAKGPRSLSGYHTPVVAGSRARGKAAPKTGRS
jgi:hypothetical protein